MMTQPESAAFFKLKGSGAEVRGVFERLDSHWAVAAIDAETRRLAIASAVARSGEHSAAHPLPPLESEEAERIWTLATAYDLAALEGLDGLVGQVAGDKGELLRMQLEAGAVRAFTLYSVLDLPTQDQVAALYRLLHVAAVGVVANRRDDVRAWLGRQHVRGILPVEPGASWDEVVRSRLGTVWLELLCGTERSGVEQIIQVLGTLREERATREPELLAAVAEDDAPRLRFHLFTLYHLLDAAGIVTMCLARGGMDDVAHRLSGHCVLARAAAAGDATLAGALPWLYAAAYRLCYPRTEQLEIPGLTAPTR